MTLKITIGVFVFLFLSIASFGQRVVDTTGRYNGRDTRERIEYSRSGEVEKETYFYANGQIEQENLYEEGAPFYLISYDEHGNKIVEWGDRYNTPARWKKKRIWVFYVTILCFAMLTIGAARKYYEFVFFTCFTLTLLFPLFIIFIEKQRMPGNKVEELVFSELLILLPLTLLTMALINLIKKKTRLPTIASILAMIFGSVILLLFSLVSNFSF